MSNVTTSQRSLSGTKVWSKTSRSFMTNQDQTHNTAGISNKNSVKFNSKLLQLDDASCVYSGMTVIQLKEVVVTSDCL